MKRKIKEKRANDSTGYTLVEPRHIRVPFYTDITRTQLIGQRHISPHSGVVRPGIPCCVILCAKLYPAAPDLYPDQTGNRRK